MNKPELEALLERVRAAAGPDRELAMDIAASVLGGEWRPYLPGKRNMWLFDANGKTLCYGWEEPARWLTSIDAAVALIERVLPGWMRASGNCGEENMPWACLTEPSEPCRDFAADAPTEPLALIEAAIKALISTSEAEDDQ